MDTLDRLDLLELEGESPWPDVDDGDDFYPIDWRAVDSPTPEAVFDRGDTPTHDWERIESEIRSRIRPGGGTPPPVVLDALGWYQPIHYFGLAWGIYIKEEAVLQLAIYLFEGIPEGRRSDDAMLGVLRMALRVVYLHEAFHHRIEWFATALEIVEREKRYTVYHDTVFKPLRTAGSDALLEEALATAESVRRLIEGTYRRGVPPDVFNATRKRLSTWIKGLPPGYNRADEFKSDGPFDTALTHLCSQIHEGAVHPKRPGTQWRLAAQMHRTHFTLTTMTWMVVPAGETPVIPWFLAERVPALSISSRDAISVLQKNGYKLVSGGKHQKLVRPGSTIPLPSNREALSMRVLKVIARALDCDSVQEMARAHFQ